MEKAGKRGDKGGEERAVHPKGATTARHADSASNSSAAPAPSRQQASQEAKHAIDAIFATTASSAKRHSGKRESDARDDKKHVKRDKATKKAKETGDRKGLATGIGAKKRSRKPESDESSLEDGSDVEARIYAKLAKVKGYRPPRVSALDMMDPESQRRGDGTRRTEEGYRIYSLDDLKIGKGGNTALCPVDCDCCF